LHCYRMLGSLPDAEDALQESLLRAWRHLGRFEARTSVRRWLYRITTNVCLSAAARGRPPAGEVRLAPYPDALLDELEDEAPGPAVQGGRPADHAALPPGVPRSGRHCGVPEDGPG